MRFMRIVAALMLVACGLASSACRPPIPKVGAHMATCFAGTFPLAVFNWSHHVIHAEGLTGRSTLMGSRG